MNDALSQGRSVKRWHPWRDKGGMSSSILYHKDGWIFSGDTPLYRVPDVENLIETIAGRNLYVLCNDILDTQEFPYINALLGTKGVCPYLSRTGGIPALALKSKRRTGFLVPTSTWKWEGLPDRRLLENLSTVFKVTGFQSTTPASLSEKILRSTLSDKLHISRPSVSLRRDILNNNVGGRIDQALCPGIYSKVLEYDERKAYFSHSRVVPSPFEAPVVRTKISVEEALNEYVTGWWECEMVGRYARIPPIQINGRSAEDGECFVRWLWSGELQDCLCAGYLCTAIKRGYGFREMSDFMVPWFDRLWEIYNRPSCQDEYIKDVLKAMMVGLPGKFLQQPMIYSLIPFSEIRKERHDFALLYHGKGDRIISDWGVHPQYVAEKTAISYVGGYIVAEMRRDLYQTMVEIERHGGRVLSSYYDCIHCVGGERYMDTRLGENPGQWKKRKFKTALVEGNRFIGLEVDDYAWEDDYKLTVVAPGYSEQEREMFIKKYQRLTEKGYPHESTRSV